MIDGDFLFINDILIGWPDLHLQKIVSRQLLPGFLQEKLKYTFLFKIHFYINFSIRSRSFSPCSCHDVLPQTLWSLRGQTNRQHFQRQSLPSNQTNIKCLEAATLLLPHLILLPEEGNITIMDKIYIQEEEKGSLR